MGRQAREKKERREQREWIPFAEIKEGMGTTVRPDGTQVREKVVFADQGYQMFQNNRYTVLVRLLKGDKPFGSCIWLSIRRNDREASRDWRDFQRIKDELVGPEAEAVELYPAESRLVDTSNQYHLWVFPQYRFPFGFNERLTDAEAPWLLGARQRPR